MRLILEVDLKFGSEEVKNVRFLVDTGAEINLIRRGIAPAHLISRAEKPLRIATANQGIMSGGDTMVNCIVVLQGKEIDTKMTSSYEVPVVLYEADLGVEGILSYEWLATFDFVIRPHRNCMQKIDELTNSWIAFPGVRKTAVEVNACRIDTPELMPDPKSHVVKMREKMERNTPGGG